MRSSLYHLMAACIFPAPAFGQGAASVTQEILHSPRVLRIEQAGPLAKQNDSAIAPHIVRSGGELEYAQYGLRKSVKGTGGYHALITPHLPPQKALGDSLAILDGEGAVIGEVSGLPEVPPSRGYRTIGALWDSSGKQLLVCVLLVGQYHGVQVGLVRPPSTDFQRVATLTETAWRPGATWAGSAFIIWATAEGKNLILELNPATAKGRTLYKEECHMRGWQNIPIGHAILSPDGKWLAFDRSLEYVNLLHKSARPPGPEETSVRQPQPHQFENHGTWLVDCSTGKGERITWEAEAPYYHAVVGWQDNDKLLLARRNYERGEWHLFSATLSLPTKND